jgi:UDP-N-acetylmuramate dehydrogenase
MPKIQKNVSLKAYNTFGLEANAASFTTIDSVEDAKALLKMPEFNLEKLLILGGGSNLLITADYDGLVVKNNIKGIRFTEEQDHVIVTSGGGEIWHELVMTCVAKGYGGIENLSLIPGTVGAAPMQNIGAYGVEIKDVFLHLEALNLQTGEVELFDKEACCFGYRESIFKHSHKGRYLIFSVSFLLDKTPRLHLEYGAIRETLTESGIENPTIQDVSNAVIHIRRSKLPDPAEIGNSGSFFKNPVVAVSVFEKIKRNYANAPSYPVDETHVKIPAGWLIEQAGWKGYTRRLVGVHKKQALVLVNYGGGKGVDIEKLSEDIKASIVEKFGVHLQAEVNII